MSINYLPALARLDSWQQRHPALGIQVAVIKKFLDDGAAALSVGVVGAQRVSPAVAEMVGWGRERTASMISLGSILCR